MIMKHFHKQSRQVTLLVAALLALPAFKSFAPPDRTELVFVGSGHKDICTFRLNLTTGELLAAGPVAEVAAPSFITVSPNRKNLYAVSEGRGKDDSLVNAFQIDPRSGKLPLLNRQPSGGAGPCHVQVDQSGRDVLVANYNSGSSSVFPIDGWGALGSNSAFVQDTGSSVNPQRQAGPHAHCIVTSPDDRFAFVCDLGLDKILVFKFDPLKGTLETNDLPFAKVRPGSGPRHMAFHPNGRFAYVINEMASTLTGFEYDPSLGVLGKIEEVDLLPADFKGQNTGAEVAVHPSGRFVYASNRGDDTIVVLGCNPGTGRLTFIERVSAGGRTPRQFKIDPTGGWLLAADQDSGNIAVFSIDKKTGHLSPVKNSALMDTPMCVEFLPPPRSGRRAGTANFEAMDETVPEEVPAAPTAPAANPAPAAAPAPVAPTAPAAPQ